MKKCRQDNCIIVLIWLIMFTKGEKLYLKCCPTIHWVNPSLKIEISNVEIYTNSNNTLNFNLIVKRIKLNHLEKYDNIENNNKCAIKMQTF